MQNTCFRFNTIFRKSCRSWDNVEKCGSARHATDDNTMRRENMWCESQITRARMQTHTCSIQYITSYCKQQYEIFCSLSRVRRDSTVASSRQYRTLSYWWQLYLRQKLGNILLRCHGNNGYANAPRRNAVRTLSAVLKCRNGPVIWRG
jgi:hypothetical protein